MTAEKRLSPYEFLQTKDPKAMAEEMQEHLSEDLKFRINELSIDLLYHLELSGYDSDEIDHAIQELWKLNS